MGCDIHVQVERKVNGQWQVIPLSVFEYRHYGLFGFLADVRNYSAVPPISPQRGLPEDAVRWDDEDLGDHSFSWLALSELIEFNYDQPVEDRRYTQQTGPRSWDGAATAEAGKGTLTTYREFLGEHYFTELDKLKAVGAERIVFGFDS